MLQIIITPSTKYSLAQMAQMAIEAGAQWLHLSVAAANNDSVNDVVDICREKGTILTIDDDIEVAQKLGMHGVHLSLGGKSPIEVRRDLGAEAIIGAGIAAADSAMTLSRADIDFVSLAPDFADARQLISDIRTAGCVIPVVAYRPDTVLTTDTIDEIMAEGFSGICGGSSVFDLDDPVATLKKLFEHIQTR